MDWPAVAEILAERGERPVVLLDVRGTIRLFSPGAEKLLGWAREAVEGRSWVETCAPPELADLTRKWLHEALRGVVRQYDCEVLTRDGARMLLVVELLAVGRGREQGLLMF